MATLTDFKKSQDATGDNLKMARDGAGNIAVAGCTLIEVGGVFGPVDDSNPFPVYGTVTAELSATDNAVLDAIAASLAGTLDVTGPLTAAELQEALVEVTGPITDTQFADRLVVTNGVAQLGMSTKIDGGQASMPGEGFIGTPAGGPVWCVSFPMMTPDGGTNQYYLKGDSTNGMLVNLGANNEVDVTSIAAGANLIGDVSLQPRTTGGLTMHKTTSAASTNATSVKASAGQIYSIQCFSVNAAARYLKIYNKASAPTVGTDTPVKTLAIPGNTAGAGFVISWPQGLALGTGIAFALTTEATDAGTTGVAVNEITVNIDYK